MVKERVFPSSQGRRKPDIVCVHDGKVYVLDVTCPFERASPLSEDARFKRSYYAAPDFQQAVREFVNMPEASVNAFGLVFGARGAVARQTFEALNRVLGVPAHKINLWAELTIFRTLMVYRHFQRGDNHRRTSGRAIYKNRDH